MCCKSCGNTRGVGPSDQCGAAEQLCAACHVMPWKALWASLDRANVRISRPKSYSPSPDAAPAPA